MLLGYQTGKKCQPEGGLTAPELYRPSASPSRGETSQRVMGGKMLPTKRMDLHHFKVIPVKRCGQEISKTCVFCCVLSHVQLFLTPWTVAHLAPLSMEFSRQEYWSGLPFPSPGDLPNPRVKPTSHPLCLLPQQADSLQLSHLGSPSPRHPGKRSERQSALSKDQIWRQKAKRN